MNRGIIYKSMAVGLPLVAIVIFLWLKVNGASIYDLLVSEDSVFEYLQAIAYLSAGGVFISVSARELGTGGKLPGIFFIMAGIGLFFITMEEISWGQRILGIETPRWFQEHNIQNEISIHNLEPAQKTIHFLYAVIGIVFSFGWIPLRHNHRWFRFNKEILHLVQLMRPRWYLMTFFLPLFLFYSFLLIKGGPGDFFTFNDQEITELLFSTGILLYSIEILKSLNTHQHNDLV